MNSIGKPERATQNRIIALFRDELNYRYLGDHSERAENSNIEEGLLSGYLLTAGYTLEQISRAIHLLKIEANNPNRSLYENNKAVYGLLRYGVDVQTHAGQPFAKVKLIDWQDPEAILADRACSASVRQIQANSEKTVHFWQLDWQLF